MLNTLRRTTTWQNVTLCRRKINQGVRLSEGVYSNSQSSARVYNNLLIVKWQLLPRWKPVRNRQYCCSAAEWLQKALQKSCKVGRCSSAKFWLLKCCHRQRFASDKCFGTKTLKKDNQRCRITTHSLQKCKECLCGIISEAIGNGLAAV